MSKLPLITHQSALDPRVRSVLRMHFAYQYGGDEFAANAVSILAHPTMVAEDKLHCVIPAGLYTLQCDRFIAACVYRAISAIADLPESTMLLARQVVKYYTRPEFINLFGFEKSKQRAIKAEADRIHAMMKTVKRGSADYKRILRHRTFADMLLAAARTTSCAAVVGVLSTARVYGRWHDALITDEELIKLLVDAIYARPTCSDAVHRRLYADSATSPYRWPRRNFDQAT